MDNFLYKIRQLVYKYKKYINNILLGLSIIIFFTILTVSFFFIFKPLHLKHIELRNELYLLEEQKETLPELNTLVNNINSSILSLNDIYEKMVDFVPEEKNFPLVTGQISLAAQNNNIVISEMKKGEEDVKKENNFKVLKYNLSCYGQYSNMINFLNSIETNKNIFIIENIKVVPADVSNIKCDMILNIYMKPEV